MARLEYSFDLQGFPTRLIFGAYAPAPAAAESLWVADEHTASFRALPAGRVVKLAAGEAAKCWASVESVFARALELGLGRDGVFIGLGGGVVCDLAAFAASIYMRGAGLELVPTTLLAMVDAAFGGKTAVNLGGLKNMAGTFYPARTIHVDTAFLADLSESEYRSGLAEVIKAGLLGDAGLVGLLEDSAEAILAREPFVINDMVRRAVLVKAAVVTRDLRETGERAFLNLGHTFGHGLEAAAGFGRFTHGQAVAWGVRRALDAGLRLGATDAAYARRVNGLLDRYGFPDKVGGIAAPAVAAAILSDKKKRGGRPRFVLQRGQGDTFLCGLEPELALAVIASGLA